MESSSYSRIWRWHFYSGLFLSPTLLTLAITGLVYLFKPQIEPMIYRHWLEVPKAETTISAQAQLDSAMSAFPESRLKNVIPSLGAGKSMQVFLEDKTNTEMIVYVNPHKRDIVGSQKADKTLMQLMHDIHGSLLIGKPGEIIMEMTAGFAFILVTTGLFLWWPKDRKSLAGVLWPRFDLKGRGWWKDFHAVPAFYLSSLIFLFLITGLPWTGINGDILKTIGEKTGTGSPLGFGGSPYQSVQIPSQPKIDLDRLLQISREKLPGIPATILLPKKEGGAAVIRWKAPRPQDRAYIHVDMFTGEIIKDFRWKDFGVIGKFILMAVALHEGTWFGIWNQILNSIVALGVIGLAISGIVLWWKRKPPHSFLSAPQVSDGSSFPKSLVVLIGIFCVLVPVTGISLIVILIVDSVIRKVN
ncbi:MAG: PepSY-associated TM helix domain-containing protein [Elusimicrobiota bacterium]